MRNLFNTFMLAAVAMFAMTMAAGCVLEKEDVTSVGFKKDVMVILDISASGIQTKAVDDNTLNTVRIFAFNSAGESIGHVYTEDNTDIHLILSVPEAQQMLDVQFYVVANEQAMYHDNSHVILSAGTTLSDLNNLFYNSLYLPANSLPFYGVHSHTLNLNAGELHTEGEHSGFLLNESVSISLERSLAKIAVYAAALEGVTKDPIISKVTLLSQGRRDGSYLFPAVDQVALEARDALVESSPNDRIFDLTDDGIDVLANNGVVGKRLAAANTDPDALVTDYYTEIMSPIYIAELPYGSNAWNVPADQTGRPAVLGIEYSFGEGTITKRVDVNMPKIERNTFYQVRCLIKADGQLMVDVEILPWEEGEDHELNFDFPTHSDPLVATSSLNIDGTYAEHTYGTPATMYYNSTDPEKGAFSVDFNMSYPVGGKWTPSIYGASESDYEIRLYKRGDSTSQSSNMVVVTDADMAEQWYTIKVVPVEASNVGKKFNLSITYTPLFGGSEYSYLLQINGGEENNLAWSDYSPKDNDGYDPSTVTVVITQIEEQIGI